MSNLEKHAMMEFKAAGWLDENDKFKDDMQESICNHIMALLKVFRDEGHSGTTAPYTIDLFKKLAMFEPIVPLTGEDWEWHEASEGVFQNRRCSHVFKQADRLDGQPYDIDGKVFWEWSEYEGKVGKSYYTSWESRVPITFPYVPRREYVFQPNEQFPNEVLDE